MVVSIEDQPQPQAPKIKEIALVGMINPKICFRSCKILLEEWDLCHTPKMAI